MILGRDGGHHAIFWKAWKTDCLDSKQIICKQIISDDMRLSNCKLAYLSVPNLKSSCGNQFRSVGLQPETLKWAGIKHDLCNNFLMIFRGTVA